MDDLLGKMKYSDQEFGGDRLLKAYTDQWRQIFLWRCLIPALKKKILFVLVFCLPGHRDNKESSAKTLAMGGSSKRPSSQTSRCQRPTGSMRGCGNLPAVNEPWSSVEGRKQFSYQPVFPLACSLKLTIPGPSEKKVSNHTHMHTHWGWLAPKLIKRKVNRPGKLTENSPWKREREKE